MNKLLITGFICLPSLLGAQVFTGSFAPQANDIWTEHYAENVTGLTPGDAGMAVNWDFSSPSIQYDLENLEFLDPSDLPLGFDTAFANSSVAIFDEDNQEPSAQYIAIGSDGIYLDGFMQVYGSDFIQLNFEPDRLFLPFNVGFGEMVSNQADFILENESPYGTILGKTSYSTDFEVDGLGTMVLPSGTFTDVFRIHHIESSTDSVFLDSTGNGDYVLIESSAPEVTAEGYFYVHDAQPTILAFISVDPYSGDVEDFNYNSFGATGLLDLGHSDIRVFPNPSSDRLNVVTPKIIESYQVHDLQGRKVIANDLLSYSGSIDIPIVNLENGQYVLTLFSAKASYQRTFVKM